MARVTGAGLLAVRRVDGVVPEALGAVRSEEVNRDAFARVTGALVERVDLLLRDVTEDVSATGVGREVGVRDDPLLLDGDGVVRIEDV